MKVVTPLLAQPLEGQVFVGEPECSPCTEARQKTRQKGRIFRLFLQVQDPAAGVIVKLVGNDARPMNETGRLTSVFEDQPQTPFELLELKLKGGSRASLENPQSCGPTSLAADLTPWSEPAARPTPRFEEPSFNVDGCASPPPFAGPLRTALASRPAPEPHRGRLQPLQPHALPRRRRSRTSQASRCTCPRG